MISFFNVQKKKKKFLNQNNILEYFALTAQKGKIMPLAEALTQKPYTFKNHKIQANFEQYYRHKLDIWTMVDALSISIIIPTYMDFP